MNFFSILMKFINFKTCPTIFTLFEEIVLWLYFTLPMIIQIFNFFQSLSFEIHKVLLWLHIDMHVFKIIIKFCDSKLHFYNQNLFRNTQIGMQKICCFYLVIYSSIIFYEGKEKMLCKFSTFTKIFCISPFPSCKLKFIQI